MVWLMYLPQKLMLPVKECDNNIGIDKRKYVQEVFNQVRLKTV